MYASGTNDAHRARVKISQGKVNSGVPAVNVKNYPAIAYIEVSTPCSLGKSDQPLPMPHSDCQPLPTMMRRLVGHVSNNQSL